MARDSITGRPERSGASVLRTTRRQRRRERTLLRRGMRAAVATVVSLALVVAGVSVAYADAATPTPDMAQTSTPEPATPAPEPPDEAPPAIAPAPEETAPEETAPEETAPEESPTPTAEPTPSEAPSLPAEDAGPLADQAIVPAEDAAVAAPGIDPILAPFALMDPPNGGIAGNSGSPGTSGAVAGRAIVNVLAGGDRTAPAVIAGLPGVQYGAYATSSATAAPVDGDLVAWCTTDVAGRCYFNLAQRAGGYLVSLLEPAAGFHSAGTILTSTNGSASGVTAGHTRLYQFHTGTNPGLVNLPQGSSYTTSSGTWANVRDNPQQLPACGINAGMLVDLSESVSIANGLQQIKDALTGFIGALQGTASQVSIHTFGTFTPVPGATNANLPLTPVGDPTLLTKVNGLAIATPAQWTNWDRGIFGYNQALYDDLDVVLVLTDGLPTRYGGSNQGGANGLGDTQGPASVSTRFIEVEHAIASANALKAKGIRVIAVGIGDGAAGDPANLAKISGQDGGSDFFQVATFDELEAFLTNLASQACEGTISITKKVIPSGGTYSDAIVSGGWQITAATDNPVIREDGTADPYATTADGVTNAATGATGFRVDFSDDPGVDVPVRIVETQQDDHTIEPFPDGDYARCWLQSDPSTFLDVSNIGADPAPGFTVDAVDGQAVVCEIVNRAAEVTAQLQVDKLWNVTVDGVAVETGTVGPTPTTFGNVSSTLELTGPGAPVVTTDQFGTLYSGLPLGAQVTVAEVLSALPPLCTNTAVFDPDPGGPGAGGPLSRDYILSIPTPGVNRVTITNSIVCETKLTLEKRVIGAALGGTADPGEWELAAHIAADDTDGIIAFAPGTSGVSGNVTGGQLYALSETPTTPLATEYVQDWHPTQQAEWGPRHDYGATGSWFCETATAFDEQGNPTAWSGTRFDGRNGGVQVPLGQWARCTATNQPKPTLSLVKKVSLGGVETVVPVGDPRWTLGAAWTPLTSAEWGQASFGGVPSTDGITPAPAGAQTPNPLAGPAGYAPTTLVPGHVVLSETGTVPGYTNGTSFSCTNNGGTPVTVVAGTGSVTLVPGDHVVCEIVNTAAIPVGTIAKQVRAGYPVQNMDGTWTIVYDVVVTNTSPYFALEYDLDDELVFGAGIDILTTDGRQPSWSGPTGSGDFDGPSFTTATLATDRSLAAGEADTYTVTVNAEIGPDAWTSASSQLTCAAAGTLEAGGFLNTATLTSLSGTETADACATPHLPEIVKSPGPVTQDPDDPDAWHVSYTVTVTAGADSAYYTLSDIPGYPVGVTVSGGQAQRAGTPDVIPITSGQEFPAQPVAIGAGETHTWTVSWVATVPYTIPPEVLACAATPITGQGFYNGVRLLQGGVVVDESDACVPLAETVAPTVTKTVTSTTQDASGLWTIVYDVEVDLTDDAALNPLGLSASYDLTDTLDFGGGIVVLEASWAGETSGTFTGVTGVFAQDHEIGPGATQTYTVTAIADVTTSAISGATTTCIEGETIAPGGFLNRALLAFVGGTAEATACSEPVFPLIVKTAGATTDNVDGTQTIRYLVEVSYPPTDATPATGIHYALTDAPTVPTGVTIVGPWQVAADDADTPAPTEPTWDGTGTWTIVADAQFTSADVEAGLTTHTYLISATVSVTSPPTGPIQTCQETGETGILLPNSATVTSGAYTATDDACHAVAFDDVGIVKTAVLAEGETSVEPGDVFAYELTVTNHGTRAATAVHVTDDDLSDRLEIQGLTIAPALTWGPAPGYVGNAVDLTIDSLDIGQSATITIDVVFLPPAPPATIPEVIGDEPPPLTTPPLESLENTACVAAERDSIPANDCDDEEIPTRDIAAVVYTRCVADAPLLGWTIQKSAALTASPIDFLWTPNGGPAVPASIALTQPGGATTWSDEVAWPGVVFTPSGISLDYPGWRPITAADIAGVGPDGTTQYFFPGTATVMTSQERALYVFNGLIADTGVVDAAWRFGATLADNAVTTVAFSVNPELAFEVQYPEVSATCAAARHSDVRIEKTASVQSIDRGASFTYTLEVRNVSDDSAAEAVVVTDAIPADLRITGVTWPGQGDAAVFPNWQSCAVAGQTSTGYGGTLTCVLFGPLQPAGAGLGASSAPTVTLAATVSATATAAIITNIGVVDYHTFGNPDDPGRDADDAVVVLASLAATGLLSLRWLMLLAAAAMGAGVAFLVRAYRRREAASRSR